MRTQVKISFKDKDAADVYTNESILPAQINVANSNAVMEGLYRGARGFQLSASKYRPVSKLDGSATAFSVNGYSGIITSALSLNSGACNVAIQFSLTGTTPENLYIEFDNVAQEHAVDLKLVNVDNNHSMSVNGNSQTLVVLPLVNLRLPRILQDEHFILYITKWSKGNSSIKITRLSTYYASTFTDRDIISVENSENSLDAQMQITPGICEQYVDARVYDRTGALRIFARAGKLTPDHLISIYALDDDDSAYNMGSYTISEWDLSSTSSVVGVAGRDKSYLFEKINIERALILDRTLDDLITILFAQATDIPWKYQDADTRARCQSILVPDNWYLASDLYTMLNKICALGMLRIYWVVDVFVIGRCC